MTDKMLFTFGVPLEVSKSVETSTKKEKRIIKGIASTEDIDRDGELVIQNGLDISYFLQQGFINYNHRVEPAFIIGYPITANINKSFYVEGELFQEHPIADQVWTLAKTLEKENAPRKLGFSIQGKILEREDNIIKKAVITMVSVTPTPTNPNALTWTDVAKSIVYQQPLNIDQLNKELAAGYAIESLNATGGSALRKESLEQILSSVSYGSVFNVISKISEIRKKFMDIAYEYNYPENNLIEVVADYFIYASLMATDSIDDAVELLESLFKEFSNK